MNKFKAISDQAVVVLGASSGIGRSTALKFAEKGASLVVAARSTKGIETLVAEIKKIQINNKSPGAKNAQVEGVICDVADFDQVKNVAKKCFDLYGRIDTWVQPAGITLFASFEDTTEEEMRRVMDVNFLGQCRGAWAALPYMKRNPTGGALIHVGSVESRRAFPYQGAYSSSKHAMEGFTEALRSELKMQNSKVQVTLLMPSNIDTPFYEKCRTKVDDGKYVYTGPAPTYKASHCADAILFASEYPTRHLVVGDGGWFLTYLQGIAPEVIDKATELGGKLIEKTTAKKRPDDNFYNPIDEVEINRISGVGMHPMPISVYNLWYQNVWARMITYFMIFIGIAVAFLRKVW